MARSPRSRHRHPYAPRHVPRRRAVARFPDRPCSDDAKRDHRNREDLWMIDVSRGVGSRSTHGANSLNARWARSGEHVFFDAHHGTVEGIYRKRSDGTGSDELVWKTTGTLADVSRDGRLIVEDGHSCIEVDPDKHASATLIARSAARKGHSGPSAAKNCGRLTEDMRVIAYTLDVSGQPEVYVAPFPGGTPRVQVSRDGGREPRWRKDGRELFYLSPDGTVMSVALTLTPALQVSAPRALFQGGPLTSGPAPGYSASSDGQRFLMVDPVGDPPADALTLSSAGTKRSNDNRLARQFTCRTLEDAVRCPPNSFSCAPGAGVARIGQSNGRVRVHTAITQLRIHAASFNCRGRSLTYFLKPVSATRQTYRFGPFCLDVTERRLSRGGAAIPLRLKVFDTLRVLVENAGRLVTKEELLQAIWPDTAVEENNLNHNVSILRKMLGEKATGQAFIETVPRVGYRSSRRWRSSARQRPATSARAAASGRNPLLHDRRWPSPGLCGERQRPGARQGVELAHPPRFRMGQPDPAPLVGGILAAPPADPLRRARQRHVPTRRDGRELRHVGAGSGNCRRCGAAGSLCTPRDLTRRAYRHRLCRPASGAGQSAGALRRLCRGSEPHRHENRTRGARCAEQPDPAWPGPEQPRLLQAVHMPVHPARYACTRGMVRRAAARVDITRECRPLDEGR